MKGKVNKMALVTSKEMFQKALNSDYAIGAFNVNNMEIVQGITRAAAAQRSSLILQASSGAISYATPAYLLHMVEAAMEETGIDICLHLDHGANFRICKECVDNGFTSVMFDGSKYTFEENVAMTKEVVEYAHAHGVVVEAELGKLAGIEDAVQVAAADATFTVPEEAAEFVERTGVDSLAVAIGTSHGAYKFSGTPRLDMERLEKIHALIPNTPLVLHGASSVPAELTAQCNQYGGKIPGAQGVPENMIREAARRGVCKVNVDTDIRMALTAEIRKYFTEHPDGFDPRKYIGPGRDAIQALVEHKIKDVMGSSGSFDA